MAAGRLVIAAAQSVGSVVVVVVVLIRSLCRFGRLLFFDWSCVLGRSFSSCRDWLPLNCHCLAFWLALDWLLVVVSFLVDCRLIASRLDCRSFTVRLPFRMPFPPRFSFTEVCMMPSSHTVKQIRQNPNPMQLLTVCEDDNPPILWVALTLLRRTG